MSSGFSSYPDSDIDKFSQQLESILAGLPKQEAKVAQFILLNMATIGFETGKSLAEKVGVPEVTVGRLLKRLGYKGLKDVKRLLRREYSAAALYPEPKGEIKPALKLIMESEIASIHSVFEQTTSPSWSRAVDILANTEFTYITGFQSVRGLAEDFARRLSLVKSNVRFISPHDGMLGEWLLSEPAEEHNSSFLVIDVVPYAQEFRRITEIAKEQNRQCIIVTDEFCHWGSKAADAIIHAPSKTGLFLESTVGINICLNLLVDAVASINPDLSENRIENWKKMAKRLKIF